jgi:transcriptional regulator with XRE-family HTH domain
MGSQPGTFGPLLKRWRALKRVTQEGLADEARVSNRHLSCLESGKAQPSRTMVLALASALDLTLRDRNLMLGAAGFAPAYGEIALQTAPTNAVRRAVEALLRKHEPYGAFVLDRMWNVLQLNGGAARLLERFPCATRDPSITGNLMRAFFHPQGIRAHVVNWGDVVGAVANKLQRSVLAHPQDEGLAALRDEVLGYPDIPAHLLEAQAAPAEPCILIHFRRGLEEVRVLGLLTTIGAPLDVAAQELIIESYYPGDEQSDRYLHELAGRLGPGAVEGEQCS